MYWRQNDLKGKKKIVKIPLKTPKSVEFPEIFQYEDKIPSKEFFQTNQPKTHAPTIYLYLIKIA